MQMRTLLLRLMLWGLMLAPLPCLAQLSSADASIRHRKAAFTLMNTYFVRIYQATHGERQFNAAEVLENARTVEMISKLPWAGFSAGSDHGNTKAKADIWLEPERFKQLADTMQERVVNLRVAAQGGDPQSIKAAFLKARESCQACHKTFRAD
jgi:cytochrome c556